MKKAFTLFELIGCVAMAAIILAVALGIAQVLSKDKTVPVASESPRFTSVYHRMPAGIPDIIVYTDKKSNKEIVVIVSGSSSTITSTVLELNVLPVEEK